MTPSDLAVYSASAQPFNDAEKRLRIAMAYYFNVTVARTGAAAAPVDAVWVRYSACVGCSEHKVRTHSREQMLQWGDTYLITAQKLVDGAALSELLGVPFWVVALLRPEAMAYAWQITDETGRFMLSWEQAVTATQATCEGGTARRDNAYLPFAHAESFPVKLV